MSDISFDDVIKSNTSENSMNYILDDESIFNEVGYKVLQNQEKYGLIKCGKLSQNGKIKLVYGVTKYKPLSILLPKINQQNYLLIISRLYDIVKHIEENGFLRCENIEIDADKIFIDSDDLSVHLVCLPLNNVSRYQNTQSFYDSLKQVVLRAANVYPNLQSSEVLNIIEGAKDGKGSFKEEIKPKEPVKPITDVNNNEHAGITSEPPIENYTSQTAGKGSARNEKAAVTLIVLYQVFIIAGLVYTFYNVSDITMYIIFALGLDGVLSFVTYFLFSKKSNNYKDGKNTANTLTLVSANNNEEIKFLINKPVFLIGKQIGVVDGVISNEKTISRVHCKIIKEKKKFYIQDMGSLNGTYVNNRKIAEDEKVEISQGDIIKLSKVEFVAR